MTINDRIALAKGWTYQDIDLWKELAAVRLWYDQNGKQRDCPDFPGTLEGVAGMMRELNKPRSIWDKTRRWLFSWDRLANKFVCQEELYVWGASPAFRIQKGCQFWSPDDRPGDCVGAAWLSVFGMTELTDSKDCARI